MNLNETGISMASLKLNGKALISICVKRFDNYNPFIGKSHFRAM